MKAMIFKIALVALVVFAGVVSYYAEVPSRLEGSATDIPLTETTAIELPPTPEAEPPKPEEVAPSIDSMANLAPESFQTQQLVDAGFGSSYGSGGNGPAIGGKGGFGSEGNDLIQSSAATDRPPRVMARGPLDYPPEAKSKGIQGYVVVRIQVGSSGGVEDVKISESQPSGFFDQAVLRSVRNWKFEPGVVSGKVAAAWITQKVRFELD